MSLRPSRSSPATISHGFYSTFEWFPSQRENIADFKTGTLQKRNTYQRMPTHQSWMSHRWRLTYSVLFRSIHNRTHLRLCRPKKRITYYYTYIIFKMWKRISAFDSSEQVAHKILCARDTVHAAQILRNLDKTSHLKRHLLAFLLHFSSFLFIDFPSS